MSRILDDTLQTVDPSASQRARSRAAVALGFDRVLLGFMLAGGVASYFALPERFPIHFDLSGNPDGYATRGAAGFFVWMLLPVTAALTSWLLRWAPRLARSNPSLWNIPHRREFLRLTPEQREPIHRLMADSMAWLTLMTTSMLAVLQVSVFAAAHGRLAGRLLAALLLGFTIVAVAFAWRTSRRARAGIEQLLDASEGRP